MSGRVLGIVYASEHKALNNATDAYCAFISKAGFAAETIDLAPENGSKLLENRLQEGNIAFCFGLQGVGSRLTIGKDNLWEKLRIPFLCVHFDHPSYNPYNHFNDSAYVANIYHFKSFLEAKDNYLPSSQLSCLLPYEIMGPPWESRIPFDERPIKLLFLKSGAPIDEFTDYFNSLPKGICDGIWNQLERAQQSPNLSLCDLTKEVFEANGLSHLSHQPQFWGVVQSMDFYLRRKRAIDLVNWLKFQEGAVIVGDGWDFIDRTGAKAEFRPSVLSTAAVWLYEQSKFIFNTNPYGRDVVHERNIIGLAWGSCVISDTNEWWDRNFQDVSALTRFRWDQPLDQQILPAINDSLAAQHAKMARAAALAHFTGHNYIDQLIAFADCVRAAGENSERKSAAI